MLQNIPIIFAGFTFIYSGINTILERFPSTRIGFLVLVSVLLSSYFSLLSLKGVDDQWRKKERVSLRRRRGGSDRQRKRMDTEKRAPPSNVYHRTNLRKSIRYAQISLPSLRTSIHPSFYPKRPLFCTPLPFPSQLIWNTVVTTAESDNMEWSWKVFGKGTLDTLSSLSLKFLSEFICVYISRAGCWNWQKPPPTILIWIKW